MAPRYEKRTLRATSRSSTRRRRPAGGAGSRQRADALQPGGVPHVEPRPAPDDRAPADAGAAGWVADGARVEAQSCDLEVDVVAVRVDADPLSGAGLGPVRELAADHRRREQA